MKSMLKKKGYVAGQMVVFAIAAFLVSACAFAKPELTKAKNECIACHTDLNTIIGLTSEIEQIRPASGKSVEASGEG